MSRARIKLLVAGTVVAAAMGVLAYEGFQRGRTYYLDVDSYLANSSVHDRQVKVRGTVAQEGIVINVGERTVRFVLLGYHTSLPVVYHGTPPEMFKAGAEVVIKGRLGPDGVFQARELLTKCASKYESTSPASRPEGHP